MTLPADEILECSECGGRLGLLTIVKGYSRLGHLSAPPTLHVPTPRAAAEAGVLGDIGGTRPQRERPATRREDVAPAGLSSLIANGTRPARKGRPRTANPSEAPALRESGRPELPPVRSMPWAASTRPGSPSAGRS